MSESNPDIVYVGTGESDIRGNVAQGDGVWTTDGRRPDLDPRRPCETRQISRIRIHPTNPDIVYVAAGHAFGPNPHRGVYKTTDGGKTWRSVLFRNDQTGVSDLILDPTNPDVLYAAFWQAERTPWSLESAAPGSGIFKTTDGGETGRSSPRTPGLPQGAVGQHRPRGVGGEAVARVGDHREPTRAACTAPTTAARRGRG